MKKSAVRSAVYLMLYYSVHAFYQSYLSKYYQQKGISGTALMLLLVSAPLMAVFALPMWGTYADRSEKRRRVLRLVLFITLAAVTALYFSSSFALMLPAVCLLGACYISVQPMGDSLILENLQEEKIAFGKVRLFFKTV